MHPPKPRSLALSSVVASATLVSAPLAVRASVRSSSFRRTFASHVDAGVGIGRPIVPNPGLKASTTTTTTTTTVTKTKKKETEQVVSAGVAEIGPLPEYRRRIALGLLKPDQEQYRAVVRLQTLCDDLLDYQPPEIKAFPGKPIWQRGFKLFGKDGGIQKLSENAFAGKSMIPVLVDGEEPDFIGPRGLWIHGEVGTGKTLLLDLFHSTLPTPHKKRIHFHHFTTSLHSKLRDYHSLPPDSPARTSSGHVTMAIARELAGEAWMICFDEFQVTDVATAVILRQVLAGLFRLGVVVVVTSNRAPDELYQGGFQRSIYSPFIDLIKDRCDVLNVRSETDYRVVLAKGIEKPPREKEEVFFNLNDAKSIGKYIERVTTLFKNNDVTEKSFTVYGRVVVLNKATDDGKAIFSFDELCGSGDHPLGPVDYLELCSRYHTIVVQSVPVMGLAQKNEARRFITFLDAAYENKVKVIMSADANPDNLFITEPQKPTASSGGSSTPTPESADAVMHREMLGDLLGGFELIKGVEGEDGSSPMMDVRRLAIFTGSDERFAFKRAVSRIKEMGSEGYLSGEHAPQQVDWKGLERVRRVEGAVDDVVVPPASASNGDPDTAALATDPVKEAVEAPVAFVSDDVPRGARMSEMGPEAYGDDFGEEAGYRGYVVRMQHRLGGGLEKDGEANGGGILKTMKERQEGSPKVQETHFWGIVPSRWTAGRTAAFWSNMSVGGDKKGGSGEGQGKKKGEGEGEGSK
ncbi:hypothetical protein HDU67_000296 [Dinochytrium kinnereticum]|nr:hypothetical protein HDU67_000296 [Dinochytrium kinnereticum]